MAYIDRPAADDLSSVEREPASKSTRSSLLRIFLSRAGNSRPPNDIPAYLLSQRRKNRFQAYLAPLIGRLSLPFDPLDLRLLEGLCVMRSNRVNLSPSLLERRERFRLRPATIAADDYAYPRN